MPCFWRAFDGLLTGFCRDHKFQMQVICQFCNKQLSHHSLSKHVNKFHKMPPKKPKIMKTNKYNRTEVHIFDVTSDFPISEKVVCIRSRFDEIHLTPYYSSPYLTLSVHPIITSAMSGAPNINGTIQFKWIIILSNNLGLYI